MNLCRLNWARCYYNLVMHSMDTCYRQRNLPFYNHFMQVSQKRKYTLSNPKLKHRPVLSIVFVGQNRKRCLDTDVFASSRTGTQSIISATQIHSSTQPSEGSPKVSSSTQDSSSSSETTGSRNVGLSPHLPSKNSEVFSHETEARNFSTVTAQKIETDRPTWSSTAIKRDCKSEVQTKIHVENSDPLCNTAENTSSIKESIIKTSKKSKDDVKSDIKSLKIPKSSIKESIKKTSKKTKDYVKSDIKSLKIPKQKKIEKSSNNQSVLANTLSKKSPSKEKSSTAKTSTQSSKVKLNKINTGAVTKDKRTSTSKEVRTSKVKTKVSPSKTSEKPVKSKPKDKLPKTKAKSKTKNRPTAMKSQEKKLVLLVPEIPPSELTVDIGFLSRMFLSQPKFKATHSAPSAMSSTAISKVSEKAGGTKQTVSESNIVSDHTMSKTPRSLKSIQSPDMSHDHSVATTREIQLDNKRPETVKEKPSADVRMEEKSAVKGKKSGSKKESQIPKGGRLKKLAQENPHQYIIPLLDLYVYQGKMEYAQSVFDTCMKHGRFKDLEVYNILLQGWAERGNIGAVKKLFSLMTKSEVEPDINSFGSALECLGRTKPLDRELVERIIKDLEQAGMTLNDVMLKHNFRRDSREVVLAVIQAVQPEFVHPLPPKLPVCSLEVVKGMYSETTEISPKAVFQLISKDEMRSKLDLQWKTEEKECINIRSVEEDPHPSQHVLEKRKILAEHKGMWWRALKKGLEQQKKKQSYKKTFGHMKEHVYPFMTILNDDDYVQLMLESLPKFAATSEGIGTLHLARELGSRVNQRYIIRKKRRSLVAEKTQKLYWEYIQGLMKENQGDRWTHREQWQHLLHHDQTGPSLEFDTHIWPSSVTLKVGNFMADILLREIQIDANISTGKQEQKLIPGLYHMYAYRSMKQVGFIKPHPLVIDLFQGAKDPDLPFDSNILPMVSPPLPWTSARFGGYPLSATKLMRCKEGSLQSQLILDKAETPELHPVLDSLNQLSSVPWIVNKKMLDIIIDIFKKEGSKELDIPQPSSVYPSPPPITSDATPEEIAKIHQERAAMRKSQAEMHSLRMDMLYKLSIANHFRDDIFWFPHNMDFRGRVYPCPPHFNHLGSDVTRSLLQFAQGQPLGEKGLDWLKIHLINLSGLKKRCSLAERLTYANEILPDILDSADQPFEGKKWWQQTDEPWQALACCMDIAEAVRSPDPEKYVSHLPIHQDGSCNGLQHYAALGRDIIGAQQVNLHPFPVPQDVYSGVAQMVEELREKDAQNGLKIAKTLKGSVHRKVVKQTVMTVVYGVTAFGGRHQIFRQLKDAEVLSENDAWYAAGYLVLKVFQSLGKMFAKTREIQDWLTESALMIAKGGSSVEWVTPLGLPIVQPYHKKNQVWVSTTEKWSLYHNDTTNAKGRPDAQKQKNAFPPNFIHSLDSTHMMLTSLHCQRSGVTFASVHDCFWTHPCSVDLMNEICREQFVTLHEQPILHNLAKNLVEKFGELEVGPGMRIKQGNPMEILKVKDYVEKVPETGEFDLKNVLGSTYFFS